MSTDLLLITGGAWHDFDGFTAWAQPLYTNNGYTVRTTSDYNELLNLKQKKPRCIVLYTSMGGAVDNIGRTGTDFTDSQTEALVKWTQHGGGLVAVHCATVSAPEKAAYQALVGGRFLTHPDQFSFTVYPAAQSHPIIEGIPAFDVFDELYIQKTDPDLNIHMVTLYKGAWHPMAWSRITGKGKMVHLAPGHSLQVWEQPSYKKLLLQATAWACA